MAAPVLRHRMQLSFAARARGANLNDLIATGVARVTGIEAAA
jgi:MoxR-like ATPase